MENNNLTPDFPVPQLEELKKVWYNTDSVAYEIIKAIKGRESVLIASHRKLTHRCLKINAVRFMLKNFLRYKFYEPDHYYNFYYSISHYPNLPMFSFKWEEKREQQDKFLLDYKDYITGYDLFLDFDNEEDLKLAYSSTYRVKSYFDKFNIMYHIKFSGKKGFHIIIEYKDMPDSIKKLSWEDTEDLFKYFAYELKETYVAPDLDISIFDLRRICKTPYSMVYPYYYIAYPLSDEQFNNFVLADYHLTNLINKTPEIRNRGLLTRDGKTENLITLMYNLAEQCKLRYKDETQCEFLNCLKKNNI